MNSTCVTDIDPARNRLYITIKGYAADDEIREHAALVVAAVAKMKPGFAIISDISEFKATTPEGAQIIADCVEDYKRHGIARLIRIVGKNTITRMQFTRVSRERGVEVENVATRAEAEHLLAGKP